MNYGFVAAAALAATVASGGIAAADDYPTHARVDYVLGCMTANGQDQATMLRCSCSIDKIAEEIPYNDYTALETVKVMAEGGGERNALFRNLPWAQQLMDRFRKVQVAADLECFR
jgi:hypothetical protein